MAFTECRVYDDDDDGDDLCYVYVHCTWSPFSVFFVHNQMEACLLHGPFFTSKSSSHVRFTIKNVNLFQVVSECIENTETKKEIYKIKLHALYLDKIIQYSSCMKRFAYDWSRWQILNMAFKFLFILFMVASFGMALWMSVSLLCFCFQCVQISALYCMFFSFLFYFGVGWVILLRIFMAFSQQNCFGFSWSYGGNTCVLSSAQHTVLFIELNGFFLPLRWKMTPTYWRKTLYLCLDFIFYWVR